MSAKLISVKKIWGQAPHSAFTDLIRFRDQWWCTFREAEDHGSSIGTVRVIVSSDAEHWESAAVFEEKNVDLRDPKLSVMPDGRLMLVAGGSIYAGKMYQTRSPRVAFSPDGRTWTTPLKVLAEDHWLWRVTWHKGLAYSVSKLGEGNNPRRGFLYTSVDGIEWQWVTEFGIPRVSETTLRFLPDDELIALTRPDWIGTSRPPYTNWTWTQIDASLGGPNFIRIPDGALWASARGRHEDGQSATVLARMTRDRYEPVLCLPSGGDTSYAGLVWHDDLLWMSYYSSHEEKTSVYLAQIQVGT